MDGDRYYTGISVHSIRTKRHGEFCLAIDVRIHDSGWTNESIDDDPIIFYGGDYQHYKKVQPIANLAMDASNYLINTVPIQDQKEISKMNQDDLLQKVANAITESRQEEYWWVGVPARSFADQPRDPITLSLRGYLDETSHKWIPNTDEFVSEKASCCKSVEPGDDMLKHCASREHVETMLRENFPGDLLEWQNNILKRIVIYQLTE